MTYTYLKVGLAALALILAIAAFAVKSKRGVLIWAFLCAGFGALAAHYQVFWVTALLAMMVPWALVCAGPWIDSAWRAKVGFCLFLALGSALCLYPTYIDERFDRPDYDRGLTEEQQAEIDGRSRSGEFGVGRFVRANIPFRLVRGLDLKGGFRLVYMVDVDEAIKDKRDRYYDDLRTELARAPAHAEDALPNVEQLKKLAERVKLSKPRDDVGTIKAEFVTDEDAAAINDEFLIRFAQELKLLRGADKKQVVFGIKQDTEEAIRDDAVKQAKETVLRRIDTLGLKEAAASIRDDDIIIEMPGNDDGSSRRSRRSSGRPRGSSSRWSTTRSTSSRRSPSRPTPASAPLRAEGLQFAIENAAGHQGVVRFAILRKRTGENLLQRARAAQEVARRPVRPDDPRGSAVVFEKLSEQDDDGVSPRRPAGARYYLFSKAEVTGDMIRDAAAQADQLGAAASAAGTSRSRSRRSAPTASRRSPARTSSAASRSSSTTRSRARRSSRARSAAARARSRWARATPSSSSRTPRSSSWCCAPARSRRRSRPRTSSCIGPSLGEDAIAQGAQGRARRRRARARCSWSSTTARAGLHRRRRRALQPAPPARDPRDVRRLDDAARHRRPGAHDRHGRRRERAHQRAHPRGAARSARARARRSTSATTRPSAPSSTATSRRSSPASSCCSTAPGPIKGFAVTLIVGIVASLFTGVVCTRLMFDWAVRWPKVKKLSLG